MIEIRILLPHSPHIPERISHLVMETLAAGGKLSIREVADQAPPPNGGEMVVAPPGPIEVG